VDVAPVVGDEQIIAAISDTHSGSKYAQRSQLRDFIQYAYSLGVRQVAHSGDWLDGCYDHGRFELSHHGIDDQTRDAIETLPKLDGLSYWGICGNHDQTFTARVGVEVGPYIEQRFKSAGRSDVHMVGNASAYLRIRGALIHLWHPKGGVPYAISYRLQKQVEAYSPGLKPDMLLTGHLHKFGRIVERGVHAFCVPCFQGPGSAFSNSLVGQPAVGGLILRWRITQNGTLRSVSDELVSYYHNEQARQVA
jgi:DNA polymerase II small subunit/DNA polymerase delta subunit B